METDDKESGNDVYYYREFFPVWSVRISDNKTINIPDEIKFQYNHMVKIVVYSILMVISAVGNITVLVITWRRRHSTQCRINTMLMHLAIADLLVTFIIMPIEIFWAATVSWWAGDIACRISSFFRTFGLYQSSFVLVCISVDRYLAVLKPLRFSDIDRRGRTMLMCAWITSAVCSIPQMFVFRLQRHPNVTFFEQCITVGSFPSKSCELSYFLFEMMMMYGLPLIIIIYSYGSILAEICKKSREPIQDSVRRSSLGFFERAKNRTLKITIVIILAFVICWTPYHVMALWYFINGSQKVELMIETVLYLFACTNSSINPIVYGVFNIRRNRNERACTRLKFCNNSCTNNSCNTAITMPTIPVT